MFSKEMESLIEATLQDGVLTDQEKTVLVKRAQKEGIDVDELDVYIQSIMQKRNQDLAKAESAEAKANTLGTVRRCVRCGGVIPLGSAVCPDCGLAIENNSEGNSVQELQRALNQIDNEWNDRIKNRKTGFLNEEYQDDINKEMCTKKVSYITSCMIPNNRSDILQMLAFTKSKANKKGSKRGYKTDFAGNYETPDLSYAFWCMFENCINLAQVSFTADPAFKVFFDFYDKENSKEISEENPIKAFLSRFFRK